ncbi:MAG: ATP-binding protein [Bacteroidota bacterium]
MGINRFDVELSKTLFAPAERSDEKTIQRQRQLIEGSEFLNSVMSKTPWMFLILNDKRQVVYSNALMINFLGFSSLDEMVGMRPGETIGCVHAEEHEGGCGTSAHCSYCGAVRAVLQSRLKNEIVTEDTVIVTMREGRELHFELQVTSIPFQWQNEDLVMVTFNDNSSLKRKEQLERVFFHDILNKAGTISNLIGLLREREESLKDNSVFEMLQRGVDEFVQDIIFQQKLYQAENGGLQTDPVEIDLHYLIRTVIEDYSVQAVFSGLTVVDETGGSEDSLVTDMVLIRRVLGNLLKNAIEASSSGQKISISASSREDHVLFCVSNPVSMPARIREHIFTRSVSSKGVGRGLGTYSIKLFTENYLQGKVWFSSDEKEGTRFYVSLPRTLKA